MDPNIAVKLARRPEGLPGAETWDIGPAELPPVGDGDVRVRIDYISLDPAMRGWINEGKSYIEPVGIGDVMRAGAVGEVIESKSSKYAVGDHVVGMLGVQKIYTGPTRGMQKVDPSLAPVERYLGGLGMPGMTAYFGLLDVGQLKDGETVLVSAASGAVGQVVCQIAKIKGCHVIGIAGGAEKCRMVTEDFGADAAIDYKSEDVARRIRELAPKGVDVYFDNVGGEILEAALSNLRKHARVVICGAIADYNDMRGVRGPRNYLSLLINSARMEGFVVFDFADRYPEGAAALAGWMKQGKIRFREDIRDGIENFPTIFQMLFKGENKGKLILKP